MKIELNGYNLDNLIKVLYSKKVTLKNIIRTGHFNISFEIFDKDYKKVKRHILNYKVKEKLSHIKRLPKFLLSNLGIILGCFIGVLFGIFVSNYTWQIQIYGTKELTNQEIIEVLRQNNVEIGKINHQTSEEIELILLNNYDRIAQVSVIKKGTAIIINLSEKLVYSETEYEPILAKQSGIIKSIKVITGTVNVKVGDYVNANDILVLPFNINADGSKVSVMPIAEIDAEMFIVSKCEKSKYETELVRTGNYNKIYNYKFKNYDLFSTKNKNSFALFETVMYNENVSDIVPFNRDVLVFYELTEQEVIVNLDEIKDLLIDLSIKKAYESLPIGEIISETTQTTIVNDSLIAITTITVLGDITIN